MILWILLSSALHWKFLGSLGLYIKKSISLISSLKPIAWLSVRAGAAGVLRNDSNLSICKSHLDIWEEQEAICEMWETEQIGICTDKFQCDDWIPVGGIAGIQGNL